MSVWPAVLPNILKRRCMMSDGVMNLRGIRKLSTRPAIPDEVEILSDQVWNRAGDEVLEQMIERFITVV